MLHEREVLGIRVGDEPAEAVADEVDVDVRVLGDVRLDHLVQLLQVLPDGPHGVPRTGSPRACHTPSASVTPPL